MQTLPLGLLLGAALFGLAACQKPPAETHAERLSSPFTILAGSELKDVEKGLHDDIRSATALDLRFAYSGTLDAIDRLANGEKFDALWVSHSKYLAMNDAMKGRILAQEKTMLSPVILGLKASKAHALGWDTQDPTWKGIGEAAKEGRFTFGMTNPASSNTGLSATIGLAAALAKNPDQLTQADLKNPQIADFFNGQSLTAGSSGPLAEAYERDPARVDGIINYESVLLSLNRAGKLPEPLTLIYPKEGIITADYPLILLNEARRTEYGKLIAFLRNKDFQTKMSAVTLRRPVNPDAVVASSIPKRTLIELAFPGQAPLISSLIGNFLADIRIPASSRYVLDLSGSMRGNRIEGLKQAMLMLASDSSQGSQSYARFQNREEVGIITFSTQPAPTIVVPMGATPEQNDKARAEVSQLITPLEADGRTAIYSSVQQGLRELGQERAGRKDKRYYTVVLMTDGESDCGLDGDEFKAWYNSQREELRGIPVFPILFGEGNEDELKQLAVLTGGRLFDARSTPLPIVFKEIRGYQ